MKTNLNCIRKHRDYAFMTKKDECKDSFYRIGTLRLQKKLILRKIKCYTALDFKCCLYAFPNIGV